MTSSGMNAFQVYLKRWLLSISSRSNFPVQRDQDVFTVFRYVFQMGGAKLLFVPLPPSGSLKKYAKMQLFKTKTLI